MNQHLRNRVLSALLIETLLGLNHSSIEFTLQRIKLSSPLFIHRMCCSSSLDTRYRIGKLSKRIQQWASFSFHSEDFRSFTD